MPGAGQQYPQYVYLQVFYAMPLFGSVWLPVTTTTYNGQTVKLISSSAAFRNEPFIQTSWHLLPSHLSEMLMSKPPLPFMFACALSRAAGKALWLSAGRRRR